MESSKNMTPFFTQLNQTLTRRQFFGRSTTGIGTLALASLLNEKSFATAKNNPQYQTRAKRVIFLFQSGGPSQFETFDFKPKLNELSGQPMPANLTDGQRLAQIRGHQLTIVGSKFAFARHGHSGAEISELLPHTAQIADDIAIVRSMQTDAINHDPAVTFMQTGHSQPGRPAFGSWLSYGLGTDNSDLPAFVVLASGMDLGQNLHSRYWGSGVLPTQHQGVMFRPQGDPVLFLANPQGINRRIRRRQLDGLAALNHLKLEVVGDPEIATRIKAYEMAYRMQSSVPELMDISGETSTTLKMYGPESTKPGTYAANCLLARRLAERGVRFIQLYHRGWDQHMNLPKYIRSQCHTTDQPSAALIRDLKQRGMLDDTIVIWSGEFGRTPMLQETQNVPSFGRDHHMKCFSLWLTGGGIRRGASIGTSDELGYNPAVNPIHVHDLHATLLHCLGIDHTQLTFRSQGRDYRLTDVAGNVVRQLLA